MSKITVSVFDEEAWKYVPESVEVEDIKEVDKIIDGPCGALIETFSGEWITPKEDYETIERFIEEARA